MGFPRRLLNDGEHVVVTSRAHAKTLAGPVLVLLLTAFLATFAVGRAGRELAGTPLAATVAAVAAVAALVLVRAVVLPFLRWSSTTYTFTDRRFVARSGVLARVGRTVPLDRVAAIDVERGLLDRVLGCGTLVVSDGGEDGRIELHDVPRVEEVQTRVAEQVHRLRQDAHRRPDPAYPHLDLLGEDSTRGLRLDHRS